jgi:hypothetical protein
VRISRIRLFGKISPQGRVYQRDLIGGSGQPKQLIERALKSELTHHLGYEKNEDAGGANSNRRSGAGRKLWKAILVKWRSSFRRIVGAALNRKSSPNTRRAARVSTTKCCRCVRAA